MLQLNIAFKKLVNWMLPKWLRASLMLLIVQAASWPVRQKYNAFVQFAKDTVYRLQHNSQVCYLRAVLNDKMDLTSRRIQVVDFDGIQGIYFWPDEDLRDVDFTGDVYFWPDNMYADSGIDFTVKVPTGLIVSAAQMAYLKSLVNEYKMAGKNYNIVNY